MARKKSNRDFSSELYIKNAHDHLFRESMQDIVIARELAFLTLPFSLEAVLTGKA